MMAQAGYWNPNVHHQPVILLLWDKPA